ncbi:MAG: UTP--glucose-1-phosphate uridylyltransferase GalU [Deltaproteobacteria bacterium]|nr:UTP--glucose-1-phosphate uridylyltransferase GalU [Deltaproteobacteria bacterium]
MKIRKAVFPAAGFGTRFLPATKAIPKEMLPLVDKPLIQYAVEEARNSSIEEIIIITGMGKNAIEDHFDVSAELESLLREKGKTKELEAVQKISELMEFAYTRQKKPLGLGHAVLCAKNLIGNEPFAVLLGDDIIDSKTPAIRQLMDVFSSYPATVLAVQRVPRNATHLYGIIKAEKLGSRLYRVTDLVEKPSQNPPSNLAIVGRYILVPEIFEYIQKTASGKSGEIQLTDAIKELSKSQPIYAYEFEGKRYDAGDKLGFIEANISLALKRPDMKRGLKRFLKGLRL